MKKLPPKKKPVVQGQSGEGGRPPKCLRTFNGAVMDIRSAASFIGVTEKTVWARVARRMIPFRKFGGRVVFLRDELVQWLTSLDGCNLAEARANREARR